MEVLQFEFRQPTPHLNVPQITEILWRIANESRQDPVMADFVQIVLAAIEELMTLRSVAHDAMLERERERMAMATQFGSERVP